MRSLIYIALVCLLAACAGNNRPLQMLSGQGPIYPPQAKSQQIEGEVVVAYDVSIAGQVVNATVVSSDPAGLFDAAALAAVRTWRFNAPLVEGERREALNQHSTVSFRLTGADKYDAY